MSPPVAFWMLSGPHLGRDRGFLLGLVGHKPLSPKACGNCFNQVLCILLGAETPESLWDVDSTLPSFHRYFRRGEDDTCPS